MKAARPHTSWRRVAAVQLWLWRHGWWGPLTVVALGAAVALWTLYGEPVQRQIAAIEAAQAAHRAMPVPPPAAANTAPDDTQRLEALRRELVPYRHNTEMVRELVKLTQDELRWSRAEFQQSNDAPIGVIRLQITVPVVGGYRKLRLGIERALRELPSLSLDQMMFRREQAAQTQLDVRLRLSMWLLAPAAGAVEPTGETR